MSIPAELVCGNLVFKINENRELVVGDLSYSSSYFTELTVDDEHKEIVSIKSNSLV